MIPPDSSLPAWDHSEWGEWVHLVVSQRFFIHRQINALHNYFSSSLFSQLAFLLNQVLYLKGEKGERLQWRSKQGALKPVALRGGISCATSNSCNPFPLLSLCSFFKTLRIQKLLVVRRLFTLKLCEPEGSRLYVSNNQKIYSHPRWAYLPWWHHKYREDKSK